MKLCSFEPDRIWGAAGQRRYFLENQAIGWIYDEGVICGDITVTRSLALVNRLSCCGSEIRIQLILNLKPAEIFQRLQATMNFRTRSSGPFPQRNFNSAKKLSFLFSAL